MARYARPLLILAEVHPEKVFSDVILRSAAGGGTMENLEILRGVHPEHMTGLRMTASSLPYGSYLAIVKE